jgi:PucR C-terminal helix-turn-helix domain/GGDEF-like domain
MSVPAAWERSPAAAGGLRHIHLALTRAVLAGEGIARVAALAAAELGGVVAIVMPAEDVVVVEPQLAEDRVSSVQRYVADRLLGRPAEVPAELVAEVAVQSGDQRLGSVALLGARPGRHAHEILDLAGLAALTAVALRDASVTRRRACADLLDDLRAAHAPPPAEISARARHLGADLSRGAGALLVRPRPGHAERVLAAIVQEFPGALAAPREDRVEALLPVPRGSTRASAEEAARRLAQRLRLSAPTGLSPFEPDIARLWRALRVSELSLVLGEREDVELDALLSGSWRLLLGSAAGEPQELQALIDSTIGPTLARARGLSPGLLDTLRAYLEHGANMNATAAAVYSHRHTISNRLERIRRMTGHDPQTPAGQAQLTLGLQALAVQTAATGAAGSPAAG